MDRQRRRSRPSSRLPGRRGFEPAHGSPPGGTFGHRHRSPRLPEGLPGPGRRRGPPERSKALGPLDTQPRPTRQASGAPSQGPSTADTCGGGHRRLDGAGFPRLVRFSPRSAGDPARRRQFPVGRRRGADFGTASENGSILGFPRRRVRPPGAPPDLARPAVRRHMGSRRGGDTGSSPRRHPAAPLAGRPRNGAWLLEELGLALRTGTGPIESPTRAGLPPRLDPRLRAAPFGFGLADERNRLVPWGTVIRGFAPAGWADDPLL